MLYLYAYDGSGVAGILFSASITIHPMDPLQASYEPLGTGCQGTAGVPTLAAQGASLPWIGESFTSEVAMLPTGLFNTAFGLLGIQRLTWNGQALPFDLTPFGMTGCTLYVDPLDVVQLAQNGSGVGTWRIDIPYASPLVGQSFFQQAFVLDRLANPLGATVSNGCTGLIGIR